MNKIVIAYNKTKDLMEQLDHLLEYYKERNINVQYISNR